MKILQYLIGYLLFSAVAYFGSYFTLRYIYETTEIEGITDLVQQGVQKGRIFLETSDAIKDLEEKKIFFFIFWFKALQYAAEALSKSMQLQSVNSS